MSWPMRGNGRGWSINGRGYYQQFQHGDPGDAFPNRPPPVPPQYQQQQNHLQRQPRFKKKPTFNKGAAKPAQAGRQETPASHCPKCERLFDLRYHTPLILPCDHTVCEQCVKNAGNNDIKCPDCKTVFARSGDSQELYEKNMYLLGKIYVTKPYATTNEMNQLKFQPSGSNMNLMALANSSEMAKEIKAITKNSSLDACNMCKTKTSSVQCYDCQEVYCNQCCQKLHSSAKGLRSHKISPLNMTYCSLHSGNVMDMYCEDCASTCCPYCVLETHQGHLGIKRMTTLEEDNKEEFKALLQECHEMKCKLQASMKRASSVKTKTNTNDLQTAIGKSFVDLHALLQKLEHGITEKLKTHNQARATKLLEIEHELKTNISALDDLIYTGKQVLSNQNNHTQNVNHLMDRMKNAIRLPHYFHEEKSSVDIMKADFEGIREHIKQTFENIGLDTPTVYKLISKNEESFDKFDEVASNSSLNNSIASSTDTESLMTTKSKNERTHKFVEDFCRPGRLSRAISNVSLTDSIRSCDQTKLVFKPGDHLDVKVTSISSPDSIYVQLVKQKQQLRGLQDKIQSSVQNLNVGTLTELPKLNSLYIVKCDDIIKNPNSNWFRGKVLDLSEDDEDCFEVQLIDFGTQRKINLQEFRYIPPELAQVAPLAYECKIYGVYSKCDHWENDVLQFLRTILYDTPVLMTVFDSSNSSLLHVDFIAYCEGDDYSVRESLIFIGFASSFVPDNIPRQKMNNKKNRMATFYKSSRTFDQNEMYDVVVTHVVNPQNFYVQLRSEQENCTQMSNVMAEYYKDKKSYVISAKCNMAVALKIKDRNKEISWVRGQIKKVMMGEGKVEAFLVDFGHTILVHWKQIQKLNESFLAMEPQAINVRLAHIAPKTNSGWEQDSIDFMKKFSESKEILQMSVHSNQQPFEILLLTFESSKGLYVNTMMVHNNLALSTGELSIEKEYFEKTDKDHELYTFELLKTIQGPSVDDDLDDEDKSNLYNNNAVKVLLVKSPDLIYIHFKDNTKFMDKLTQLSMQLQQHYSKEPLVQKEEWKINDFAVAYNSDHKQYYRVLIENISEQGVYKVFARDFAISFDVLQNDVGVLHDQFFYNPPFAFRCQLAGIKPMGSAWSLLATDYVSDAILKKKNVFFAKAGQAENMSSCPGIFWYRISTPTSALEPFSTRSFNLNKQLVRNGLATYKSWNISHLKINKLPESNLKSFEIVNSTDLVTLDGRKGKWLPPRPITEEKFVATATYVDDNANIYFHVHSKKYILVKIENILTEYFENALPPRKNIKYEVGDRCSVKYHVNNNWYRGCVTEVMGNEEFKVCMIDYGNVEEVSDVEIRPEICFENEPVIANMIQLQNVYPQSGFFNTSETDMLHSLVVDKNIQIEITNFKTSPPTAIVFEDDININEYMVKFVPNCTSNMKKMTKNEIADVEDDVIIDYNASDDEDLFSNTPSTVNRTFTYKKLPDQDNFKITIINILGFNKIVFELTEHTPSKDDIERFETLCSDINSNAKHQPKLTNFSVNTPCLALFEDEKWYRGNIIDVNSDELETLTIHFVDYGNFEKVSTLSVREIQDDWLVHPVEQYIAELYKFDEIKPEHYTYVCEYLSGFYNETKKAAVKSVNPLVLQLFDDDDDDNVNAFRALVVEGILPEL